MYSRAERNLVQHVGSTTQNVGPGTYDINSLEGRAHVFESYAPFSSLTMRDGPFTYANETPGPGYYDLNSSAAAKRLGKGGSSLANKSKRFSDKPENIPGPGAYTVESNKENKSLSLKSLHVSKQRVKINRKKNAPSIQDPKLAYGFEEGTNGELIPQAPPEKDSSMGPAYYSVFSQIPSQYKGVHFAKYASRQAMLNNKTGPGPGEYDIAEPVRIDVEHFNMKNVMIDKKPELNIPRYPEVVTKTVEKENLPGPGKYETKRLFDPASKQPANPDMVERPPFGSQSKRFDHGKMITPGPGAYNEQRNAFDAVARLHSLKRTPFLQSSVRFDADSVYKTRSAPGPGQYRLNGFAEDIMRKSIIESRRKPAFNQSAPRKFSLAKKDDYERPGPANYQIPDQTYRPKHDNMSANFASNTKHREVIVEDTPGPTAYNVSSAYDNLVHYKREPPRNKDALRRQESFNVVARREFNLSKIQEIPGPASYDVDLGHKTVGVAKQSDKRWKHQPDQKPGPADYELSVAYQDTVLKGTFNATLNNPLILKRQSKSTNQSKSDPGLSARGGNPANSLGFNAIEKPALKA